MIKKPIIAILTVVFLIGCGRGSIGKVEGVVSSPGGPVPEASVEVYLKPGTGGDSPLAVSATDQGGEFSIPLPRGVYYLVARCENPNSGPRLVGRLDEPIRIKKGGEIVSVTIPVTARGAGEEGGQRVTLKGKVMYEGTPIAEAVVATYPEGHPTGTGPGYLSSSLSDQEGFFNMSIPIRPQKLVARLRRGGDRVGGLALGDLTGEFPEVIQPVAEEDIDLGILEIHPVRPEILAKREENAVGSIITGLVKDSADRPVAGLYALAYRTPEMTARPAAISPPTSPDGEFRLIVPGPGTYYLGVRSRPGGPAEPGEIMGSYQESADHSIVVTNQPLEGIEIMVQEIW